MKIGKFVVAMAVGLNMVNDLAFAQEVDSLTCDSSLGRIRLDLSDQTADIDIYCHQIGCSGLGKIRHHTRDLFEDTFLLEMNMNGSSGTSFMMIKVKNNGIGEIFNHPKISALHNCKRN